VFKDGTVKQISKEEVIRIEKDWKYWTARRRARKVAFEEIEGQLLSGMSKEEIWEKAGLEEVDF
jgi:26S proteasome regulatory subunit (ATPase 3-interacting protein)